MKHNKMIIKPHPFSSKTIFEKVQHGKNIREIVKEVSLANDINDWFLLNIYVEINGVGIANVDWEKSILKENDHVIIQFRVPQGGGSGGGKNILTTILSIVVVAASFFVGPVLAAGWNSALGLTASSIGFMSASVGSALVAAGGLMAVSALVPATQMTSTGLGNQDSSESKVYSLSGMSNYNPSYQALPMVLGTVRYTPPHGALPYTHIEGNDQYMHMYVLWGHGRLEISDMRLGETPLSEYNDYEIQTNEGTSSDPELTLYPLDVYEENVNIIVRKTAYVQRNTIDNCQKISVDVIFPSGLTKFNDEGNRVDTSCTYRILARKVGTGNWTSQNDYTETAKTAQPLRISHSIDVRNSPGTYEVRVERITDDNIADQGGSDRLYNDINFAILRSIKYQDPVNFDIPVAATQLTIKATDQLSGTIDDLNAIVTSICLDYNKNTDSWIERKTNNPASLFRHVLQGPGCAKPLPDNLIGIDDLEEWHEFCELNNFEYNLLHDGQKSVQEVLTDICHAGRATFRMLDAVRTVAIDRPGANTIQLFTPENTSNFSSKKTFLEELHAYRIVFNNEETDFAEDELFVYNDGYTAVNATLIEALQFVGITNSDQVEIMGRYHLATRKYRPEVFSWDAGWDNIACSRGDLIEMNQDVISVGLASGRLKGFDGQFITLDQDLPLEDNKDYVMAVRLFDGDIKTLDISKSAETNKVIYTGIETIEGGELYSLGERGKETIEIVITSKTYSNDLNATLSGVQYSWDEIQAYLDGFNPDFDSNITKPVYFQKPKPSAPIILSIVSDESVLLRRADGSLNTRAVLTLQIPPSRETITGIKAEVSYDGISWVASASRDPSQEVVFDNLVDGETVQIRVATITENGIASDWVYQSHDVIGKTSPPPTPTDFVVDLSKGEAWLSWSPVSVLDLKQYEIFQGNDFDSAELLYKGLAIPFIYPITEPGNYKVWLRSVDTTGLVSDPVFLEYNISTPPNVINVSITPTEKGSLSLTYTEPVYIFGIAGYKILVNNELVSFSKSQEFLYPNALTGQYNFEIFTVDDFKNESSGVSISYNVENPHEPKAYASVIDNNVNIYLTEQNKRTFPVTGAAVYRGTSFNNSELIGKIQSTFFPFFEKNGGEYVYLVTSLDVNGNESLPYKLTAKVDEPPDFVLFLDKDLDFKPLAEVDPWAVVEGENIIMPFFDTTWEGHYNRYGYNSPQDQIDDGNPIYLQPNDNDADLGPILFDYGVVVSVSSISIFIESEIIGNPNDIKVRFGYKELAGDNYTYIDNFSSEFLNNVRYISVELSVEGGDGAQIIKDVRLKMSAKDKREAGTRDVLLTDNDGTYIPFETSFYDVTAIVISPSNNPSTPASQRGVYAQYDFEDIPNPQGFYAFLLDVNGNRMSGKVSYTVSGV